MSIIRVRGFLIAFALPAILNPLQPSLVEGHRSLRAVSRTIEPLVVVSEYSKRADRQKQTPWRQHLRYEHGPQYRDKQERRYEAEVAHEAYAGQADVSARLTIAQTPLIFRSWVGKFQRS